MLGNCGPGVASQASHDTNPPDLTHQVVAEAPCFFLARRAKSSSVVDSSNPMHVAYNSAQTSRVTQESELPEIVASLRTGFDDDPTAGQGAFREKLKTGLRQHGLDLNHGVDGEISDSQRSQKRTIQE